MDTKTKHIAAIDLGSSTIRGIVAQSDPVAGISVLAVEEVDAADAVRHGRVINARETSERVNEIIRRLENNAAVAPGRISAIYVANGGRSLISTPANATIKQGAEAEITPDTLAQLHREARYNLASDRDVLVIAPRRYFVDQAQVKKVVGAFGNTVRGEFTVLTCSPENRRALDRVNFLSADNPVPREYVTRILAQTEMALTDSDRQRGVAFVDFGAETTTLAVFREGALQMVATLPMGSANITRDLCTVLGITTDQADNIKHTRGRAVAARVGIDAPDAESREIISLISARTAEIIANINHLLSEGGFKSADLPAGIVIAGGGSRLNGFAELLEAQTKLKVRPAAVDASIVSKCDAQPADYFDLIALARYAAAHSDIDCLDIPEPEPEPEPEQPLHISDTAQGGFRRQMINDDDPNLLADDPDDYNGSRSYNEDTPIDDIPRGSSPEKIRKTFRERLRSLRDWMAPQDEQNNDLDS